MCARFRSRVSAEIEIGSKETTMSGLHKARVPAANSLWKSKATLKKNEFMVIKLLATSHKLISIYFIIEEGASSNNHVFAIALLPPGKTVV